MKRKDTKQQLIRTAVRLFGQRGFHNVSMREIARELGIQVGSLYNYFDSKEAILEETLATADRFLSHLNYSRDEIVNMLKVRSPARILKDFVSFYDDEDDRDRMDIYRLLYMEMYNHPRILNFVYEHFLKLSVDNLKSAMDTMIEAKAIPPGDSLAIAELWSRTSLVYGYIAAHGSANVSWKEYNAMTDFFIDLAVRGVQVIPVESSDTDRQNPGAVSSNQVVPANTKGLILHKALDLFSGQGYASVSIRQIAEACGINGGSIYHYFAGKDALMQEIVDTFLTGARRTSIINQDVVTALKDHNQHDIIRRLSFSYNPTASMEEYKVYRILFREQYANPILGKIFLNAIAQDIQLIIRSNEDHVLWGMVPPCDIGRIAIAYVHTMWSFSIGATMGIPFMDEECLRPRIIAVLVSLIAYGYLT